MKFRAIAEAAAVLVLLAMATSMAWNIIHKPAGAPSPQFTPAPSIPQAAQVKVVAVPGPPQILTVEKERIVHDLKLSDSIAKDPDKQVVATAQTPGPDGTKTDALAIIDTKTGATDIETKEERPWFSFLNEKEIGMRAGATLNGLQGALYARWTFARTWNVHYAIYAEATSPPFAGTPVINRTTAAQGDGKVMLDMSYRW